MKDTVEPEEVQQAAKYCPYLEILFGPEYEVIPALVLTAGSERFEFVPIGESDLLLPVCSGDMLFNVFDEYIGFLNGKRNGQANQKQEGVTSVGATALRGGTDYLSE